MSDRKLAVLPLTATGVVLLHRVDPASGRRTLAIPQGPAHDARSLILASLGIECDDEPMGVLDGSGDAEIFRCRLPARARLRPEGGADVVVMNFLAFETAIDGGRVSDATTIATWLRHRLLQGERTRRRLPRPVDWTPERIDRLRSMWLEGAKAGEIARTIGTSRDTVMGEIHRLGLTGLAGSGRTAEAAPDRALTVRFAEAFGREPMLARGGDAAMLVALAAIECGRDPVRTSRMSGVHADRAAEILARFDEDGIWKTGDPAPARWTSPGHGLAMMVDAQVAYGIFRGQVLA